MPDFDILKGARINRIVRNLQDELELAKPLTFLRRVPLSNVIDNSEILATYTGKIYAANIIMNDSQATVVETGDIKLSQTTNNAPKIKIGRSLTEEQLERLDFYASQVQGIQGDLKTVLTRYEQQMARELVLGVRETMNWLCAGMFLDNFAYDRQGIKIASTGFGTPAQLKSTLAGNRTWVEANLATMDAITDIQALGVTAQTNYGKVFNRVDMSLAKFQLIIQSTAFKNQVRQRYGLESTDPVDIGIFNIERAREVFTLISGFQVNLEDKLITFKNGDGGETISRVLPDNKVIVSSTDDDGDDTSYDLAQGVPVEGRVARFQNLNGMPPLANNQSGILSYYTSSPEMNPPDYKAWAVVKCFPRKHNIYVNGILTVA